MIRSRQTIYSLVLLGGLFWCGAIVLPSILATYGIVGGPISEFVNHLFSRICHQDPHRSIMISGQTFGVCARCSAIYFGFVVGTIAIPTITRSARCTESWGFGLVFGLFLAPMLVDVGGDYLGFWTSTMATRICTGIFFGFGAGFLITPLAIDALYQPRTNAAITDSSIPHPKNEP